MPRTKHSKIKSGQKIFSALAYSSNDILKIGMDKVVDMSSFINNPVLLDQHNHDKPIGQVLKLSWRPNGLRVDFTFDTESKEGKEAERKWMRGLKSSLSVGMAGKWEHTNRNYNWRLTEISQVSVPMDPDATAKPNERFEYKMADVKTLSLDEGNAETMKVCLSVADADFEHLNPVYVNTNEDENEDHSDPIEESDQIELSDEQITNPDEDTIELSSSSTESTNQPLKMEDNKILEELVEELKESKLALSERVSDLEASLDKSNQAFEELQSKYDELVQEQSNEKDRIANLSADDIVHQNQQLLEREENLEKEKEKFESEKQLLHVEMAVANFKDLLPRDYAYDGKTVRDVYLDAAPKGTVTEELSTERLRGILENEQRHRFAARVEATARKDAVRHDIVEHYISPMEID